MDRFDISIIGGGVIGLAVARTLSVDQRFANKSIVILEQEAQFGQHISSRNSEVIHAGIYYPEDSLKARLCVRGKALLYDYCQKHDIAHKRCGKLIVASDKECDALLALQQQALRNGVSDLVLLTAADVRQREPDIKCDMALFSPSSGIVDSHQLMATLLHESEAAGALFARQTRVSGIEFTGKEFLIDTVNTAESGAENYRFASAAIVNCAGLFADKVLAMFEGADQSRLSTTQRPAIHFCKGDYFSYTGGARLNHLVYPMPEANTVGLGIHATIDLGGGIRFGPDTEYVESLDYDIDARKKTTFANAIRRYLPSIKEDDLQPAYSGIRPKLSAAGEAARDFVLLNDAGDELGTENSRVIHLMGIESPGLTSSLALAEMLADRLSLE